MRPVTQTKFGPVEGNCFAACIASLLEVPIDEVLINPSAEEWLPSTQDYLRSKNLFYLEVRIDVAACYPLYELHDVWVIYFGRSPRGDFNHAVIGKLKYDGEKILYEMIHDPHPDSAFLGGKPKGIGFLAKLNPAKP